MANGVAMFNGAQAKKHLHLVYDGTSRAHDEGDKPVPNNSDSSVPPFRSLPNGVKKDITEEATEEGRRRIEEYLGGSKSRRGLNNLYRALRELWGEETFEGTRDCHDNMKQRCKNFYASLDSRFNDLPDFLYYMGPRPYKTASIHRKDNDKGYSPDNCEWADKITQSRERTNTVFLTCDRETLPLTEWAERQNLPATLLRGRRERGWTDEEIVHGRKGNSHYSLPDDAPWPPHLKDYLETQFRKAGGKTHEERLAFLWKLARYDFERLPGRFKEDWTFSDIELSAGQQAELEAYSALHDRLLSHIKSTEQELTRLGRYDLLERCKEKSVDDLFMRKKPRRYRNYDDEYDS